MSVKTIKKLKINLADYTGPLDAKPEPKTLQECLAEAGEFPFCARAIAAPATGAEEGWPIGSEVTFTGIGVSDDLMKPGPRMSAQTLSNIPRWQLLGHKT